MADEALNRRGENISSFKLTPGPRRKFYVIIDGQIVAGHRHDPNALIFPNLEDMMKAIAEWAG